MGSTQSKEPKLQLSEKLAQQLQALHVEKEEPVDNGYVHVNRDSYSMCSFYHHDDMSLLTMGRVLCSSNFIRLPNPFRERYAKVGEEALGGSEGRF